LFFRAKPEKPNTNSSNYVSEANNCGKFILSLNDEINF
jgi:hypothetical protein